MKNSIVMFIFLCFRTEVYFFLEICSKSQQCLLKLKFRIWINLKMQNSINIFIFLGRKYHFCVNLILKFKRVTLRQNLIPTFQCLIDAPSSSSLINFLIFFHPEHFSSTPSTSPRFIIYWGKVFNPSLKRYIYADIFAISQEWPVCSVFCFTSSCKEANTMFCFVSQYKEANLFPITDLISQK